MAKARRELTETEKAERAEKRAAAVALITGADITSVDDVFGRELPMMAYVPVNTSEHRESILAKCGTAILKAAPMLRPGLCVPMMESLGNAQANRMAGGVMVREATRLQPRRNGAPSFMHAVVSLPTPVFETDEEGYVLTENGAPIPVLDDGGEPAVELRAWIVLRLADPTKGPKAKGAESAPAAPVAGTRPARRQTAAK